MEGMLSWCWWELGTALLFSGIRKKGVAKLCTPPASLLHQNLHLWSRGDECNMVFWISCFAALFLTTAHVFRRHQISLLCVLGSEVQTGWGPLVKSPRCMGSVAHRRQVPTLPFKDGQLRDVPRTSLPEKSARAGIATGCFPFPKISKTFWWGRTHTYNGKKGLLLLFIIQSNWLKDFDDFYCL